MSWRLSKWPPRTDDTIGRPPARCLVGHTYLFELSDRAFQVFWRGERLGGIVVMPPLSTGDVRCCVICGMPLVTIEGGS